MSRRPLSCWGTLASLACALPMVAPPLVHADTCAGLSLNALMPVGGVGTTPNAVAVGDFDRDGLMDVAVANSGSNSVSILLGNGAGGFTNGPGSPISTGAMSNPVDIAAGDLDQDGILDLVVAFGTTAQARVLRGLSTPPGSFDNTDSPSPLNPFPLNAIPTRIYLAPFTSDADLDLVVLAEMGQRLLLYGGAAGIGFTGAALTNIDLSGVPGEQPSGGATLDFNRDGRLDLAVVMRNQNLVRLYTGNGSGLLTPGTSAGVGTGPRDVAVGDINRDGWPDLVTADSGVGATASVLLNSGGMMPTLMPEPSVTVGGVPIRVALVDLDHDGVLDLAALDASGTPRVPAFQGRKLGPPYFDVTAYAASLDPGSDPRDLAVGRLTSDGRADLVTVTALSTPTQARVVENRSGTPCAGTSFARAPRAYAAGDAPVSTAAADFDRDGRTDLAVAVENDKRLRLLKNVAGHFADFTPPTSIDVMPRIPAAVATADFDSDGNPDLVAAMGSPDTVQVFRGNGIGGLAPGDFEGIGVIPSAIVVGDFDGNGFPDVAATSEGSGFVYVYLGDGLGGLAAGLQTGVGAAPRALVAGFFNADARLDLAVANSISNNVSILLGNGNGTFIPAAMSPVAVGISPQGIAAADIDGDMDLDLVTADNGSNTVSVLQNDGTGLFSLITSHAVPPNPTAVALLDLAGDPAPDVAVTSGGNRSLTVLTNTGGTFGSPPSNHSVRNFPRAITPIDADADGRLDLAVPCRNADSVVVLLARPPGPPPLLDAPRIGVGDRPRALVSADLDGDGDLDLAVASLDDTVALRKNDGSATFSPFATPSYAVGKDPESIVAADFDRDGRIDLALSAPGEAPPSVSLLFGAGAPGAFMAQSPVPLPGAVPDDLAVGDFDRDGDLDLAVCDKQNPGGAVRVLRNDGSGVFGLTATVTVMGDKPTAIVAGDFDRDGDLDLAVGDDISANVRILTNDGFGGFMLGSLLALAGGDLSPVSITAGDFDGDGDLDLAAAAFIGDRLHVFRNTGGGMFAAAVAFATPATLQFVTAADLNLDGKPDLAAVAAGLVGLRGKGAVDFELPETWVAGQLPWAAALDDFNRDGRPDAAVVNEESDDVSLLLSTTCLPQRLDVAIQPLTCDAGGPPYFRDVVVEVRDDGGNLAACATGAVVPSIAPGTGEPGAVLGPPPLPVVGLPLANGIASFTAANALSIDRAGRRYRLRFSLEDTPPPNLPPALSRSFTLGSSTIQILGPSSFCAPGSASYGIVDAPDRWDAYTWTLDGTPVAFTPNALLSNPANPLVTVGPHTLGLTTRLDGCVATAPPRNIFVGDLQSVTLLILGGSSVCVDCIGGSAKAEETGGGTPVSRQWGFRTVSVTGAITPIPGETFETYVLKGASFPGPGTYFVVVTTTPLCGPIIVSNEWMVTVVPNVPGGEVRHLAASSRGNSATGENRLLWVNTATPQEIKIRWNRAPVNTSDCLPPESVTVPATAPPATDEVTIAAPAPNMKDDFLHSGLSLDTAYCYSVFVKVSGVFSPGRTVKARPFDSTAGSVKWAYATGGTAVAPPTVSSQGILVMSNDRTVHALTRGSSGGEWPASWVPTGLMGVAHSRSPVVPFAVPLNGADTVLFAADDATPGFAHAIDARTGNSAWAGGPQSQGKPMTGAPGGMFTQFTGIRDVLFVGTRDSVMNNELRALNLADGVLIEAYAPGGLPGPIGPINGTPAIDYATRRVYFASHKRLGGDTLFCLDINPSPPITPVFTYKWSRDLGNITGSPVLRGGRVYVGTDAGMGTIYSLDAATGLDDHTHSPLDGPVKGFLFPDRRNDDLIFATDTKVWSLSDDGPTMTVNWQWTTGGLNPSVILFRPQTSFVYVGSANGKLYELDFSLATMVTPPTSKLRILGDGLGQIGAPSLDIGMPQKLLIVGSESGTVYGVEVPFVP